MSHPLIVIPARMAAQRLPNKPLADLCGKPMILHVVERAMEAKIAPIIVATDSDEIADIVRKEGVEAILTDKNHPSGSDRVFEAIEKFDKDHKYNVIINLQGDLPTLDPHLLSEVIIPLSDSRVDISTLAAIIKREEERFSPNIVKVVGSEVAPNHLRALYFTRATAPWGEGDLLHHIGLYAYKRQSLQKFVSLPSSQLEKREKLEQLRAIEAGMRIDVRIVDTIPLGVDTFEDLELARSILSVRV